MKIDITKLERSIHGWGDWHDKPLRWAANGPGTERQCFATKKEASRWASIRRNSIDFSEALTAYLKD